MLTDNDIPLSAGRLTSSLLLAAIAHGVRKTSFLQQITSAQPDIFRSEENIL